jgi:hypothetical protein
MSTPNDPQDPYSAPDGQGSGDQSGSVPPYQSGAPGPGAGQGGIPQYGQYSSTSGSDPSGAAGQPAAYPGYGQQGGYGQPGGYGGPPPQNYLVFSILTTVLCCLPLGIASIVFSSQVNSKWNAGDQAGAVESARKAKQFAIWSAIAGVVFSVLYGILIFAGVLSTDFTTY